MEYEPKILPTEPCAIRLAGISDLSKLSLVPWILINEILSVIVILLCLDVICTRFPPWSGIFFNLPGPVYTLRVKHHFHMGT